MARKGYSLGSLTDYVNTKFNISGGEVTGNLNVQGILSEKGERVFSPNNKPTPEQIRVGRYWGYSDYLTGTLIETSMDASQTDGSSFTVDIVSKSYKASKDGSPLHIIAEGYLYQDKITSANGLLVGGPFQNELTFLKLPNGKLGIWFARQSYWNNYGVIVTDTRTPGWKGNLVTTISDAAKPVSDKSAEVSFNRTYGTYFKPTATDVGAMPSRGAAWNDNLVGVSRNNKSIAFEIDGNGMPYIACDSSYVALHFNNTNRATTFAGEVKSTSFSSYRIIPPGSGTIGSFWRNDSINTYLMFTNAGDAESGDSNNLRPVRFNNATGQAHFDNGVFSTNGFHLPHSCSITWNNSAAWSRGIGWSMKEDSSTGHLIIHRYEDGVWKNAPFKFQNDLTFVCDGNGNFNDVYIRSDRRLKSNVVSTEDNLSKVLQLNPVKYDKKKTLESEETEEELGLIAQEVEEILPLAVVTSADETQLKALKPYALIATLVGAVKELKAELDELKAQINQTK